MEVEKDDGDGDSFVEFPSTPPPPPLVAEWSKSKAAAEASPFCLFVGVWPALLRLLLAGEECMGCWWWLSLEVLLASCCCWLSPDPLRLLPVVVGDWQTSIPECWLTLDGGRCCCCCWPVACCWLGCTAALEEEEEVAGSLFG